jgi:dTMP kinase
MASRTEVTLYLAARAQHVLQKIKPLLMQGTTVLCDRFYDATLAYQCYGRGLPLESLQLFNEFVTDGLVPDRTYLFDLDVEEALSRMQRAGKTLDRMEMNAADFHKRVRNGYLELAKKESGRIRIIPAGGRSADEISHDVAQDLSLLLGEHI